MIRSLTFLLAALCVLPPSTGAHPGATPTANHEPPSLDDPAFTEGSPAKLKCRITGVTALSNGLSLLEVRVSNPTKFTADPLRFGLAPPTKKRRGRNASAPAQPPHFDRARMPHVGRFGPGIPPGGSAEFLVPTVFKNPKKLGVSVLRAAFHDGDLGQDNELAPTVEGLAPSRGTNSFLGQTFDTAKFTLVNPLPRTADIWLLAQTVQPKKEAILLGYRVPANGRREIEFGARPTYIGFDDSGRSFSTDTEFRSVEVVDWVVVAEVDHGPARDRFAAVYRDWAVWPGELRSASATFKTVEKGEGRLRQKDVKLRLSGTVTVGPDRRVSVRLDKGSERKLRAVQVKGDAPDRSSDGPLQRTATRYLRRRPASTFLGAVDVKQVAADSVQLYGLTFDIDSDHVYKPGSDGFSDSAPRLDLDAKGRIVSEARGFDETHQSLWTTAKIGDGWVQSERRTGSDHSSRETVESWKHKLQDGLVVPTQFERVFNDGIGGITEQRITFGEWTFDFGDPVAQTMDAPGGPGAAALRTAWDGLHQFPSQKLKWSAKATIQTPGTDLSWQGHARLSAEIEYEGFIGAQTPDRFDLGGKVGAPVEEALGGVYFDRLGMWHGSDPQSMGPFDAVFEGATISARDRRGWHVIADHPFARIQIVKGELREAELRNGTRRRYHYEDFGGTRVITRIERDVDRGSEVRIRPTRLGELIVPEHYQFIGIFGEDWGPETFELHDLRLLK